MDFWPHAQWRYRSAAKHKVFRPQAGRGVANLALGTSPNGPIAGPPFAECIEKYLATCGQDLDPSTLSHHRLALERLQRFLNAQNVLLKREVTVDHLETFKTAGLPRDMRTTTKATTFAKIRCFLRSAFRDPLFGGGGST